jgi:hypothetical protein
MAATANIRIKDVTKNMVVKVKVSGMAEWRLRTWLSLRLFKIAALICPFQTEFDLVSSGNMESFNNSIY